MNNENKSSIPLIAAEDMVTRNVVNKKITNEKSHSIPLITAEEMDNEQKINQEVKTNYDVKEQMINHDERVIINNHKKKLIEVALPLDIINEVSSKEKLNMQNPRNISLMHPWWSRKPLSVTKAVLFASITDDPINYLSEKDAIEEREKLFKIIKKLVNLDNQREYEILKEIREYMNRSTGNNLPIVYDPFCGGGSIPFAAQILGLNTYGSDLNPVAVMLTKSLIEFPYKYKDQPPKSPMKKSVFKTWNNAAGLADDIRYYGEWIGRQAFKEMGHMYPKVKISGKDHTIVARLYCREVTCPNPLCLANSPLINQFWLAKPKNKRNKWKWLEPIIDRTKIPNNVTFKIKIGQGEPRNGTVTRNGVRCISCGASIPFDYISKQGKLDKINDRLIAIVAEGHNEKIYTSPDGETMSDIPNTDFLKDINVSKILSPTKYGYDTVGSMFNPRQRYAMEIFVKLVDNAKQKCLEDCHDEEYAKIISVYLTIAVSRLANRMSSFCMWHRNGELITNTFTQQNVQMSWDYAETNPFSSSTGNWKDTLESIPRIIESIPVGNGKAFQCDAAGQYEVVSPTLISTDPPYYSSIFYADFSDYFYSIFRVCLKDDFPDLFLTITTPKKQEIVAAQHRYNDDSKNKAGIHFKERLKLAFKNVTDYADINFPITIYYAFKEKSFDEKDNIFHTAWESILSSIIEVGLQIVRTWPIRTERVTALKAKKNALASSIVLVCRKREVGTPSIARREFIYSLKKELPIGLKILQESYIAPIDIDQSAIGLGMEVFSRYSNVLEADGSPMSITTALHIINKELYAYLTEQKSDMDNETRFCVTWFEQFGWNEGLFGDANTLATARCTTIDILQSVGVIWAKAGRVRLLKREELEKDWDPINDKKLTVWKTIQCLINALEQKGEIEVVNIIRKIGDISEPVKELSYRLFSLCEKKGWQEDALEYNSLISSWRSVMDKITTIADPATAGWK